MVPMHLDQTFDYYDGEAGDLMPGDFVTVPFGNRERIGVVWRSQIHLHDENGVVIEKPIDPKKIKSVLDKLEVPPLNGVSMVFCEWVANYTLSSHGMVLKMMMSAPHAFKPLKPRFGVQRVSGVPQRMTPAREKVLALMNNDYVWPKPHLAEEAEVSVGVINGLVKAGALIEVALSDEVAARPKPNFIETDFAAEQEEGAHRLKGIGNSGDYQVVLLDGVTGSGKTEVYFEAIAGALEAGRQILIMLPEISLTSQFLNRFAKRFGVVPASWHSGLSDGERGRIWRGVGDGSVRAVIGARSALFLPFTELGVIVVDEEHDAGYKQEQGVIYHARDMAVVRGALGKCGVVLASATPSFESLQNAQLGRYGHVKLKSRFHGSELPEMGAIDMRRDPPEKGRWLSPILVEAMQETLKAGQQSLLFLNRRGFAPLTLCRNCGFRFQCPQCSSWLVEHRSREQLSCHHCGFRLAQPKRCPKCEQEESLVPCGPGVERIAEEVTALFPEARQALLSSDLVPTITQLKEVITQIEEGEADIIIGTQIVAKGHNFPGLQLVGVVDGDLGLQGAGDPRAAERTFQLLHQVSGRAGRGEARGVGFIQTYLPEHPVMSALLQGDREEFFEREMQMRQMLNYPPFGRLVGLIVSAKQREIAELYGREVAKRAPRSTNITVMGPVEAPLSIIRGRHRFRILVKAPREVDVQAFMRLWQARLPAAKGDLRLTVDIDPYNFM